MKELSRKIEFDICPILKTDLSDIVKIHSICFPDSFSTAMQSSLLLKFYETYFDYNSDLFFAAKHGESIIGFAMGYGFFDFSLTKKFIKNNLLRFTLRCFVQLIKFDKRAWKKVFAKRHNKKTFVNEKYLNIENEKNGDLLSIAVLPDFQKNGAGGALEETFIKALAAKKYRYCSLCTEIDNAKARKLYESKGFQIRYIDSGVHYIKEI